MSFRDIEGQDRVVSFLKGALGNNRVAHAYIFTGPSGVGKGLTALNFAKAINCRGLVTGKAGDPSSGSGSRPDIIEGCDQCMSCKKIDAAMHPDIFILKPEKDGASIKIDAVRSVIQKMALRPYGDGSKICVIENADSMTLESQNAVLKTLEEPPADSVFILITTDTRSLVPTILSRAQIIKFMPLASAEVKSILTRKYKIDGTRAHILAHLASGTLGEALERADTGFFERRLNIIKSLVDKTLFDSDLEKLSRQDLKICLDVMLSWYRDILIAKAGIRSESMFINIDKGDIVLAEARRSGYDLIYRMIEQIIATNFFLDQNANPKLAMSVLSLTA